MLYPMAINPHGRVGPLLMRFLFGHLPKNAMAFDSTRSDTANRTNAAEMYRRLNGILPKQRHHHSTVN